MWKTKSAQAKQLRSERSKIKNPIRIKRVPAQLMIRDPEAREPTIYSTRLILNDFTPRGVGIFVPEPVMVGQEVSITIEYPSPIYLRGRVYACIEVMTTNRVHSEEKCAYRLGIEFTFDSEEEAEAVRNYSDQLHRTILYNPSAA